MKGFWLEMLPRFGIGIAAGFLPWLIYRYPQYAVSSLERLVALPQWALPAFTVGVFLASEGFQWRKTLTAPSTPETPSVPAGWLSPAPKWSLVGGLSAGIAVAAYFSGDKEIFSIAVTFALCSLAVVWMIRELQASMNHSLLEQDSKRQQIITRAERLMCLGIAAATAGVAGIACQFI